MGLLPEAKVRRTACVCDPTFSAVRDEDIDKQRDMDEHYPHANQHQHVGELVSRKIPYGQQPRAHRHAPRQYVRGRPSLGVPARPRPSC